MPGTDRASPDQSEVDVPFSVPSTALWVPFRGRWDFFRHVYRTLTWPKAHFPPSAPVFVLYPLHSLSGAGTQVSDHVIVNHYNPCLEMGVYVSIPLIECVLSAMPKLRHFLFSLPEVGNGQALHGPFNGARAGVVP